MWPECISEDQWSIYQRVIADCRAAGLRFAVGGGLAIGVYTGLWRATKDIDLYVLPEDREKLIQILTRAGLVDYYDELPYDRAWIYRSTQGKVIVDVIWAMANHKTDVDERWILGGPEVTIWGETFRIVPPEEMIWAKLYVMQRDRCDWPDVLNMLYSKRETVDWRHLIDRLGVDAPLLHGVLELFRWLAPNRAQDIPAWVWRELERVESREPLSPEAWRRRADLLDRRRWFSPLAA
jgi:Nucleotidyl transferase of unknown function (DUF2204)